MKRKPKKTRTVTRKAWGWYDPTKHGLCQDTAESRDEAQRWVVGDEVVVRVTLTAEVADAR